MMNALTPVLAMSLWLLPGCLLGQNSFRGKVVDAETGKPLVGANIVSNDQGTVSSAEGEFDLALDVITKVRVSFVGYQTQYFEVDPDKQFEPVIMLVPNPNLEEVVVQAVRAGSFSPVTQTTLGRREIDRVYLGQDPVFALESKTPSVMAYSESGSGFVNYSLMRLRGIDQTRINITLDGAPLNDMIDQGVFFSNFNDFGSSIESLQMQRGVGSSTNGTASYAGSVNFESTRLNDENPSAKARLLGGSFGTFQASGAVKTGLLDNNTAFYARYTKTASDGYKYHSGTNSDSYFYSGGYFGEKDLIKITSFVGRTRNQLAYLPVFVDDIRSDPRTNYLDENDKDDFGQQFVQLQHTHWFQNGWSLTSSAYYGGAGGDFPYGFTDAGGNLTQVNYWLKNDHLGLTSYVFYQGPGRLGVSAGLHGYTFRRQNEERIVPDNTHPYYDDLSQKDELSSFAKLEYDIGKLTLYGDMQLRMVRLALVPDLDYLAGQGEDPATVNIPDRSWTFLNPRVGLSYKLGQAWNLYSSFGRSGREPTRADILGSTMINPFNLAAVAETNSVKPEYVNDFEMGVRVASNQFRSQANFFYMSFNNEIAPTGEFIIEGFVQLRQNISNSFRSGLEWEWLWKPVNPLRLEGNMTYMKTGVAEFSPGGSDLVFEDVVHILSPEWLLNASIAYDFKEVVTAGLEGRYLGESYLELTNQEDLSMPSFMVVNLYVVLRILKDHTLSLHANNLFDKQYFTSGAPVDVDFDGVFDGPGFMVQAPRNFMAEINLRF